VGWFGELGAIPQSGQVHLSGSPLDFEQFFSFSPQARVGNPTARRRASL